MTKIELTLSPNYVESWTVVDAIRELFQNAIDQEQQYPDNSMSWDYNEERQMLTISNRSSKLDKSSLLLGGTTKSDDPNTIGQFGEGYKIATLVLLRNGKNVTFYNHGHNEVWKPRFVDSRRFGAKILTFMIDRYAVWSHPIDNNLSIEVDNISNNEYEEICRYNLHMRGNGLTRSKNYDIIESNEYGEVLKDMPGMVFVNGLYVCEYKPYLYGYNFKPQHIKLDRDRKMASDFDLKWLASRLWSQSTQHTLIHEMLEDCNDDVAYISYNGDHQLCKVIYDMFIVKYGHNAVPVTNQSELDALSGKYRGVIVSSGYKSVLSASERYNEPDTDDGESTLDRLNDWFTTVTDKLDQDDIDKFEVLYNELCNRYTQVR